MKLRTYLDQKRGRASALALALGITPVLISQWAGDRPVPVERCAAIEQATNGAVTRRDLRQNDWWLIWPELVTDEFPVPDSSKGAA